MIVPETAIPLDESNLATCCRVPTTNASVLFGLSKRSFLMYHTVTASVQAERFCMQSSVLLIAVCS